MILVTDQFPQGDEFETAPQHDLRWSPPVDPPSLIPQRHDSRRGDSNTVFFQDDPLEEGGLASVEAGGEADEEFGGCDEVGAVEHVWDLLGVCARCYCRSPIDDSSSVVLVISGGVQFD